MRVVEKSTVHRHKEFLQKAAYMFLQKAATCQREFLAAWLKGTGESPIKQKAAFVSLQVQLFAFSAQFIFLLHMFTSAQDFMHVMACFGVSQHFHLYFRAL